MKVVFNSSNKAKIHQYQIQIHEMRSKMNTPSAAVFLALFIATAISAAPSANIAVSIHHPNVMEDWISITKCIQEVFGPEIVPEVKLQWQCTTLEFAKLIPQWEICLHQSDSLMQSICKANIIIKSTNISKEFETAFEKVVGKEKIDEIHGKVKNKCFV